MDKDMDKMTKQQLEHSEFFKQSLERSRQKLLDLTRRNRLLNFREGAKDIAIVDEMANLVFNGLLEDAVQFEFSDIDELKEKLRNKSEHEDKDEEIEQIEKSLEDMDRTLPESGDQIDLEEKYQDTVLQTPYSETVLKRKLRNLYGASKSYTEETGANALYLTIGLLEWSDSKDSKISKAPLILIPVQMEKVGSYGEGHFFIKYADEPISTNFSLSEKLLKDFDIKFPAYSGEVKPESYWNDIEQIIPEHLRENGWNILREMALGLFSFNKQIMWHDLNPENWPSHAPLEHKKVLNRIILGAEEKDQSIGGFSQNTPTKKIQENKLRLVKDADISQQNAIIQALESNDGLVIEGPPGTGKSQTITNLISVAMSQGLTILFVAEKMAALNVVHNHLSKVGLDYFCLQLHGLKSSKKELLISLKKRIEFSPENDHYMGVKEDQLESLRQKLMNFSKLLNQKIGPENLYLYEMFWKVEKLSQSLPKAVINLKSEINYYVSDYEFNENRNLVEDLGSHWDQIPEESRKAWLGFLPTKVNDADIDQIKATIKNTVGACIDISDYLNSSKNREIGLEVFKPYDIAEIASSLSFGVFGDFDEIDETIVGGLLHQGKTQEFKKLTEEVKSYIKKIEIVDKVFSYSDGRSSHYAKYLYQCWKNISGKIINPEVEICELGLTATSFKKLVDCLESLNNNAEYLLKILNKNAVSINAFQRLYEKIPLLRQSNLELLPHLNSLHVKSTTKEYLLLALKKNEEIQQLANKQNDFLTDKKVVLEDMKEIKNVIEGKLTNFFAIFNKEYRTAKKKLKPFLKNSNGFKKNLWFLNQLNYFIDYLSEKESFKTNEMFMSSLGSGFKGVNTNWNNLEKVVDFSQDLKKHLGKENAVIILGDWDGHLEKLEKAEDHLCNTFKTVDNFKTKFPFPEETWSRSVVQIISDIKPWIEYLQKVNLQTNQDWCNTNVSFLTLEKVLKAYYSNIKYEANIEQKNCYSLINDKLWKKSQTQLSQFESINKWIEDRLALPGISDNLLKFFFDNENIFNKCDLEALTRKTNIYKQQITNQTQLLSQFGELDLELWFGGRDAKLDNFVEKLDTAFETSIQLHVISKWVNLSNRANEQGLSEIKKLIGESRVKGTDAAILYECLLYNKILDDLIEATPELKDFSSTAYQNLQSRFAEMDLTVLLNNAKRIQNQLLNRDIPKGTSRGKVSSKTELSLIRHEIGKKSRHLPVRQLLNRAGNALLALKPCFLMSPLSVSQYLAPGQIHFDLVVMDEASQIKPEDALSAIARANKAIIVGDSKQLPPTSFFNAESERGEDDEETVLDDTESILEVCSKQMKFKRLKFHYRSEHESLIQFSNLRFYDSDLITIPSPYNQSEEYGVFKEFVEDSNYRKGKNPNEAKVVVEHVIKHFQDYPSKSLGVATFNKAQAELITDLIDKARQHSQELNKALSRDSLEDKLFIKNLENVQGDERDVIIISTTYGPEVRGAQVAQRFGPINSELGWRRLNVIASRAKQRMQIITSLKPSDIRITSNTKKGLREFKKFLEFVYSGSISETGQQTGGEPDSDFEISVINIINKLGYDCHPQVGVSKYRIDIGVVNPKSPGEYLLGVECDGAAYHSSISARDRDRLRQENLERKGWKIHRIWSTDWFHSREVEIDKLDRMIKSTLEEYAIEYKNKTLNSAKLEKDNNVHELIGSDYEEEQEEEKIELKEALNRFWEKHISRDYPEKQNSILNDEVVAYLIKAKPTTDTEWFKAVPHNIREKIDVKQMQFKHDILDLIFEYC